MLGNPAIAVLCDAYSKGIRSYDVEKAYRYALNTSRLFGNNEEGYTPGSISHTLEYAYSDWCMARLSEWLGKEADKDRFEARARSYSSIYDTDSGWFRPRNKTGEFQPLPKAGRLTEGYGCTESNAYQQGWFVPHNVEGMVQMMGGRKKVLADLTDMFERTPKNYFGISITIMQMSRFIMCRSSSTGWVLPSLPRNGHGIFVGMLIRMQYWDW